MLDQIGVPDGNRCAVEEEKEPAAEAHAEPEAEVSGDVDGMGGAARSERLAPRPPCAVGKGRREGEEDERVESARSAVDLVESERVMG